MIKSTAKVAASNDRSALITAGIGLAVVQVDIVPRNHYILHEDVRRHRLSLQQGAGRGNHIFSILFREVSD